MTTTKRYCFHADESFVNPISRQFQVVRITENEPGYTPVSEHATLKDAEWTARSMNTQHGLTEQDVIDIRTSSMREHLSDLLDLEARLTEEATFHFTVETAEGATFTPWTDGWAIGYKVTAPGKPDRWIFLNPSQTDDLGETNAFIYVEDGDPNEGHHMAKCYHHYNIWDD